MGRSRYDFRIHRLPERTRYERPRRGRGPHRELRTRPRIIRRTDVYDRFDILYLDAFTLRRADRLPIVPTLGLKIGFNSR